MPSQERSGPGLFCGCLLIVLLGTHLGRVGLLHKAHYLPGRNLIGQSSSLLCKFALQIRTRKSSKTQKVTQTEFVPEKSCSGRDPGASSPAHGDDRTSSKAAESQVSLRVLQPQWQSDLSFTKKEKAVPEWSQNRKAAVR